MRFRLNVVADEHIKYALRKETESDLSFMKLNPFTKTASPHASE